MVIERLKQPFAQETITNLLRSLLDASTLCTIATVTRPGNAYVNTAYFAWSADFRLVWLSAPEATHSENLRANASAAIAVFDSNQVWGEPDRGVQLFGSARMATGRSLREVDRVYRKRFPGTGPSDLIPYCYYVFRPRRVKLFDERGLGPGVFVTAKVSGGGRTVWERTEKYVGLESEIELP